MSEPTEPQRVIWYYNPDTQTITAEVQGDGHSVAVATIPADPAAE